MVSSAHLRRICVTLCTTVLLSACDSGIITTPNKGFDQVRFAPCTGKDTAFTDIPFEDWPQTYHLTVAETIEAHLESLHNPTTEQLDCSAADYSSMIKPTGTLKKLAMTLPPWEDPARLQKLSEMDLGPVLLEYLRTYECSLAERRNYISIIVPKENASSAGGNVTISMDRIFFNDKTDEQRGIIDHELAISRTTLNRTLTLVGGEDRLRPLSLDIECLKRVSLDIRNILGLVSQASACLPRIRDARGSLRDLHDPTQE